MSTAVVSGGSGFVGANLTRRLLRDGHRVHLLVRPERSTWRLDDVLGDLELHEVDLADREGLTRVLAQTAPAWIFHLAVHGAYSWQRDLDAMLRTNMLGTAALVEAATEVGFEAFVNTGSSSEYGAKDHAPREDEALEPNSHYAVTKAAATLFCSQAGRTSGLRIATLRLYSAYGPYEEPNRLIPALVCAGLRGGLPDLANPSIARDFVHVDDVVESYLLATERAEPGAVYNIGTGTQATLREAVEAARMVFGVEREPAWGSMPDRAWDTDVWVADSSRARAHLGWKPRLNLERGLEETGDWFREDLARVAFYEERQAGS